MPVLSYRREPPPRVWRLFGREWLGLSARQADRWWGALNRSAAPRAVQIRSAVLCQAALPFTHARLDQVVCHNLSPQALVAVLEDLVNEDLLSRQESSALQEAVLHKTGPHGQWKGAPRDSR